MRRIAVASHVALVKDKEYDGIGNVMIETLMPLVDDFIFVRHSMDGLLPSEVRSYKSGKVDKAIDLRVMRNPSPLRYITEVLKSVWYFSRKEKVDVYVGIDPLNAVAGVLLKKLRRVDAAIFYTADYSPNRFDSNILNKIYHWIDAYCVRNADEVWSVSSRIVDIRSEMGLSDDRNIFLPNVPPIEYNDLRKNRHDKYNLITYGIVDTQLDYEGAIEAVARLKGALPKISFTIIGNGPEEDRLKRVAEDLGVSDRVHFTGRLPLSETLEYASRSGIGLALYTGVWGFNQYGDSTKCREYFNFGLPVISTDTHSTVDEIIKYKTGLIVKKDTDEYVRAIHALIDSYDEFSRHSLHLGELYEGAHRRILKKILS